MLRTHALFALAALLCLGLTACGSSSGGSTTTATTPEAGSAVAESEPNDTSLSATTMAVGQFGEGNVDIMGDEDYWCFAATEGQLLTIELLAFRFDQTTWAAGGTQATLVLYDTDGVTRLATHEYEPNFSAGWTDNYDETHDFDIPLFEVPATGTYYLRVAQDDPMDAGGAYALRVALNDGPAVTYREMEPVAVSGMNDTPGMAEAITPGRIKGFHVDDEADVYSFTITEPTLVRFKLTAHRLGVWRSDDTYYDPDMSLYDTDGTTVLRYSDDAFYYDPAISWRLTVAGTYYIEVQECCEDGDSVYYLDFEAVSGSDVAEVEPNDNAMQAQALPFDTAVVATKAAANEDWYAVDGTAGDAIWIWHYPPTLESVDVLAPDGTTLLPITHTATLGITRVMFRETGTHYLRVDPTIDFEYTLRVERPFQSQFESEANDTAGTADTTDGMQRASGVIQVMDDVDVYSFEAEGGKAVIASVICGKQGGFDHVDHLGSDADLILTVRDAEGTVLASVRADPPGNSDADAVAVADGIPSLALCFIPPADGTYFLEVEEEDATFGADKNYFITIR